MPSRPPRCCSKPGCAALATSGSRCPAHAIPASRWGERGSAHSRGYGATWRRLRRMILNRDPVCKVCERELSTEVDHIVSKAAGGDDREANLRGLCAGCHAAKTSQEGRTAAGRRSRGSGAAPAG